MDQQRLQVPVSSLADTQQRRTAARRALTRYQAQPRSHLSAVAELRGVTHRRHQRGRRLQPDTRDRHQPLARLQSLRRGRNLCVEQLHPFIQTPEFLTKIPQQRSPLQRQLVLRILQNLRKLPQHRSHPLRRLDAVLQQEPRDLVALPGAVAHRHLPRSVQLLDVSLRHRLHPHEPHRRSPRRLGDTVRVVDVVLVRLHIRGDELRTHQHCSVPQPHSQPAPVVRAPARLHRHHTPPRQLRRPPGLLLPGFQVAGSPHAPAGYNYGAKLRIAPAGLSPASTATSLAAPLPCTSRQRSETSMFLVLESL